MYKTYEVCVDFVSEDEVNVYITDEVKEVSSVEECLLYIGDQAILREDFSEARISTLYKKEELTERYESIFEKNNPEYGINMPIATFKVEWTYEPKDHNTIGFGQGCSWPIDEYEKALEFLEAKSKEEGFCSGKIIEIFMNAKTYYGLMSEINELQEEKDE